MSKMCSYIAAYFDYFGYFAYTDVSRVHSALQFCAEETLSKLSVLILSKDFGRCYLFKVISAGALQQRKFLQEWGAKGALGDPPTLPPPDSKAVLSINVLFRRGLIPTIRPQRRRFF